MLRAVYAGVLALVLAVVLGGLEIWYSNHVARESNRAWCSLIDTLDDTYRQQPPTTPTGEQVAAEVHALRLRLGC
jgi:hypothetical protein